SWRRTWHALRLRSVWPVISDPGQALGAVHRARTGRARLLVADVDAALRVGTQRAHCDRQAVAHPLPALSRAATQAFPSSVRVRLCTGRGISGSELATSLASCHKAVAIPRRR